MRWTALLVAGCVTPLAGCYLTQAGVHNLVNEPIEYFDEKKVTKQLREEAEDVLKELCGHRGRAYSHDFKDGFVDGYADFLERGGNAVPPAVPPLKYRRGRFLNPDGHARIHDYFAGFQAGADTAAQSGKRQYLTVPVLVPDPPPERPVNASQTPLDQCRPTTPTAPQAGRESLPEPRPVDPATGLPPPNRPGVEPLPADPVKPPVPPPDVPKTDPPKPPGGDAAVPLPLPAVPPVNEEARKVSAPADDGGRPDRDAPVERVVVPPLRDVPRKPGLPE